MKLREQDNEIERFNTGQETTLRIKTTSKLFDVLSSGIYADNILAIVRELSCNAYDSHVAANKKNVPFEIHLPTHLEPYFSVKDFGTGLSEQQIFEVYTTYGESTKTDSDELIGALGLGCKSPFSYTKAYQVIARFDGNQTTYSMFINEHGIPSVTKMHSKQTDQPNGLEVKFSVNEADTDKFISKTREALKWFEVKPKICGINNFVFNEINVIAESDQWKILQSARWGHDNISVVMGNVEYKINLDLLELPASVNSIIKTFKNIVLFVEMGQIDFAPSREEIRYDKKTKQVIGDLLIDLAENVLTDIDQEAITKNLKTGYALRQFLNSKTNKLLNKPQNDTMLYRLISQINQQKPKLFQRINKVTEPYHTFEDLAGYNIFIYNKKMNGLVRSHKMGSKYCFNADRELIVYDDIKSGAIARTYQYLNSSTSTRCDTVILIRKNKHATKVIPNLKTNVPSVVDYTEQEFKSDYGKLLKMLDGAPIVKTSSMPSIQRTTTGKPPNTFSFDINRHYGWSESIKWNINPLDVSQGGLYFLLLNRSNIITDQTNSTDLDLPVYRAKKDIPRLLKAYNKYYNTDFDLTQLVGVGKSALKKIEKNNTGNWFNFFERLQPVLKQHLNNALLLKELSARDHLTCIFDRFYQDKIFQEKYFKNKVNQLNHNSVFFQIMSPFIQSVNDIEYNRDILDTITTHQKTLVTEYCANKSAREQITQDLNCKLQQLYNTYPMLQVTSLINHQHQTIDVLFEYINKIDNETLK